MKLDTTPCPDCEATGTLTINIKLVASPLGSHSLAGAQVKVSARERPVLSCTTSSCDFELVGEVDGQHAVFPSPPRQEPA